MDDAPTTTAPRPLSCDVPDWDRYRSPLGLRLELPSSRWGGPVSFAQHLGKPLTAALWKDIVGRLRPDYLRVGEWQNCMGHPREVSVILGRDGNVFDITYQP